MKKCNPNLCPSRASFWENRLHFWVVRFEMGTSRMAQPRWDAMQNCGMINSWRPETFRHYSANCIPLHTSLRTLFVVWYFINIHLLTCNAVSRQTPTFNRSILTPSKEMKSLTVYSRIRPSMRKHYVSPKCYLRTSPHNVTSKKTNAIFTAVRT